MIWQVSAEISIVPWDKRRANSTRTGSIRARLPEKVKKAAKVASSPPVHGFQCVSIQKPERQHNDSQAKNIGHQPQHHGNG